MLRQEATVLKTQLATLRTQITNLQKAAAPIAVRLEESKLSLDTTEKSLLTMVAEQSRLQAQLLALRDDASSMEMAMDAATTAAALTTLQQTVRNREKAVELSVVKRDRYLPWLKYFDEVSGLVCSQQNEAIAKYERNSPQIPSWPRLPSCFRSY